MTSNQTEPKISTVNAFVMVRKPVTEVFSRVKKNRIRKGKRMAITADILRHFQVVMADFYNTDERLAEYLKRKGFKLSRYDFSELLNSKYIRKSNVKMEVSVSELSEITYYYKDRSEEIYKVMQDFKILKEKPIIRDGFLYEIRSDAGGNDMRLWKRKKGEEKGHNPKLSWGVVKDYCEYFKHKYEFFERHMMVYIFMEEACRITYDLEVLRYESISHNNGFIFRRERDRVGLEFSVIDGYEKSSLPISQAEIQDLFKLKDYKLHINDFFHYYYNVNKNKIPRVHYISNHRLNLNLLICSRSKENLRIPEGYNDYCRSFLGCDVQDFFEKDDEEYQKSDQDSFIVQRNTFQDTIRRKIISGSQDRETVVNDFGCVPFGIIRNGLGYDGHCFQFMSPKKVVVFLAIKNFNGIVRSFIKGKGTLLQVDVCKDSYIVFDHDISDGVIDACVFSYSQEPEKKIIHVLNFEGEGEADMLVFYEFFQYRMESPVVKTFEITGCYYLEKAEEINGEYCVKIGQEYHACRKNYCKATNVAVRNVYSLVTRNQSELLEGGYLCHGVRVMDPYIYDVVANGEMCDMILDGVSMSVKSPE